MAIAYVNSVSAGDDSVDAVTTGTLSVTIGNLLVLGAKFRDDIASGGITVSNSGTLQTWNTITTATNSVNLYSKMWWAVASVTDGAMTFSMGTTGTRRLPSISVMQFSGAHATAPLDVSRTAAGSADLFITSPSFTPTNANAVAVAFGSFYSAGTNTADTGYTAPAAAFDGFSGTVYGQYKLNTGTGSQTATAATGGNVINNITVATFFPAGGTTTPITVTLPADSLAGGELL